MAHITGDFVAMCDLKNGACAMDGAAQVACNAKAQPCPTKAAYGFVDPSEVQPYLDIVHAYGWGNYMFQTQQGASYSAHQFLFGATSAPSAEDDHQGIFAVGTSNSTGCAAPSTATANLINPQGVQSGQVFPCFERRTVGDLLGARAVTWRYYGSDGPDWGDSKASGIWIAPNSIKHICVAEGGKCTGREWKNHLEFAPSQVLSDISFPTCNLRGVSWVIPDAFELGP